MKRTKLFALASLFSLLALSMVGLKASADDLEKKPWQISLGGFAFNPELLDDTQVKGFAYSVKYTFKSVGTRRQNEDSISITGAAGRFDNSLGDTRVIGVSALCYEHTWGFGSMFYSLGAGFGGAVGRADGYEGRAAFAASVSRLGVWFDKKQSFGISLNGINSIGEIHVGTSLSLIGRF